MKSKSILEFISLLLSVIPYVPNVMELIEKFKAALREHVARTDEEWEALVEANEAKFAVWKDWAEDSDEEA